MKREEPITLNMRSSSLFVPSLARKIEPRLDVNHLFAAMAGDGR